MSDVLVVDDDRKTVDLVRLYLERAGFDVRAAYDGRQALDLVRQQRPDLVVLDLMLPRLDGLDVCHILQQGPRPVPVIMLTARTTEEDKLFGLETGADDYVTKPFSPRELVARVKVVLRRAGSDQETEREPESRIGELVVDHLQHEARLAGTLVHLTPKEFRLLQVLAREPGRAFERHQLLERAFGYDYEGLERTVDVHVAKLRKKIEPDPTRPIYVLTVPGVGYKLPVRMRNTPHPNPLPSRGEGVKLPASPLEGRGRGVRGVSQHKPVSYPRRRRIRAMRRLPLLHSLQFRLLTVLVIAVVAALGTAALVARASTAAEFVRYVADNRQEMHAVAEQIAATTGDRLLVTNPQGRVILDSSDQLFGEVVSPVSSSVDVIFIQRTVDAGNERLFTQKLPEPPRPVPGMVAPMVAGMPIVGRCATARARAGLRQRRHRLAAGGCARRRRRGRGAGHGLRARHPATDRRADRSPRSAWSRAI